MQIFVRHPGTGQTMVYTYSHETTIQEFTEWVQDRTLWPSYAYYILRSGKILPTTLPEFSEKTFGELQVEKEETFSLVGRLHSALSGSKKKN